ncbi:MAG: TIGR02281 family clan AA aspartic protease [Gammaproteobacteria bacterium]
MSADPKPQLTKRLGRGMAFAAWLLVLGLLSLFFTRWYHDQQNPNRDYQTQVTDQGTREITLQRNRYGHYVASGTIDNQPVVFMLDTGATDVSIPQGVATRLGLRRGAPLPVSTANGDATVYATRVDSLTLGGIGLRDVRANINPHMGGDQVLLGMSVLKHLELVQRGDRLTLRQYANNRH